MEAEVEVDAEADIGANPNAKTIIPKIILADSMK